MKRGQKCLILEKNKRIGGRAYNIDFHNSTIALGAGVIRTTDKLMLNLISELGLTYRTIHQNVEHHGDADHDTYTKNIIASLSDNIIGQYPELPFDLYAQLVLDADQYHYLKSHVIHNDLWNASAVWTVHYYPVEEILQYGQHCFHIIDGGWNKLTNKLSENLDIRLNTKVHGITANAVQTDQGEFEYDQLILTGPLHQMMNINMPAKIMQLYDNIGSVSFIRLYTYHAKPLPNLYLRTDTSLTKIISINEHILMTCYAEDHNADLIFTLMQGSDPLYHINAMLNTRLDFIDNPAVDYVFKYWKSGVHYIKNSQEYVPVLFHENIAVVGEINTIHQGWAEGAIYSAQAYLNTFEL